MVDLGISENLAGSTSSAEILVIYFGWFHAPWLILGGQPPREKPSLLDGAWSSHKVYLQ